MFSKQRKGIVEYGTYLKLHLRQLEHDVAGGVSDLRKCHIASRDSLQSRIVERHKVSQHCAGLVEGAEPIVFAHTVLLQEVILQHAGNFQCDLVALSQCALSDELHDLSKIVLLLQNLLRACSKLNEAWLRRLVMRLKDLGVLGI